MTTSVDTKKVFGITMKVETLVKFAKAFCMVGAILVSSSLITRVGLEVDKMFGVGQLPGWFVFIISIPIGYKIASEFGLEEAIRKG